MTSTYQYNNSILVFYMSNTTFSLTRIQVVAIVLVVYREKSLFQRIRDTFVKIEYLALPPKVRPENHEIDTFKQCPNNVLAMQEEVTVTSARSEP